MKDSEKLIQDLAYWLYEQTGETALIFDDQEAQETLNGKIYDLQYNLTEEAF